MPIHFDIETDTLYLRGNEKGIEQGIKRGIIKLWQKGFEPAMISNIQDLPVEYVERVIAEFQKMDKVK